VIVDVATGKGVPIQPPTRQCEVVAFSPDSRRIALAGCDYIEIYDPNGTPIEHLEAFSNGLEAIVYLPKTNHLRTFARAKGGTLRDWNPAQGPLTKIEKPNVYDGKDGGYPPYVHKTLFSPDGSLLLVVRAKRPFVLCDAATGESLARFDECRLGFADAVFSPDGKQIATTTGEDRTVKVWDVAGLTGKK
jgi:WD40 repeat protein